MHGSVFIQGVYITSPFGHYYFFMTVRLPFRQFSVSIHTLMTVGHLAIIFHRFSLQFFFNTWPWALKEKQLNYHFYKKKKKKKKIGEKIYMY
jgi:hypothetical protein